MAKLKFPHHLFQQRVGEMAVRKSWQLVIADDLDYGTANQIGRFISSFSAPGDDIRSLAPEYYLWKIKNNPAGPGFVSLAIDGDKIVGTTTVTRKRVWFHDQLVDAAEIGDTFTDTAYQRQGIFTSLVHASRDRATANGACLIYGTPNENSLLGYEAKCSFLRKRGLDMFLWVLPLKPSRIDSRKMDKLKIFFPRAALDKIVTLSLKTLSAVVPRKAERVDLFFDSAYDILNENVRRRFAFMLSRSATELNFRLVDNPDSQRYGLIVKRNHKHELEAVLVYKDCLQNRMRVLFIADLFGVGPWPMTQVWNEALILGLERDYDMIAVWAPKRWSSLFSMMLVPPMPLAHREVIFYDSNLGREALHDAGRWLFSILDSDNI